MTKKSLVQAFSIIAFAGAAFAQSSGSITGTVKDSNGGVIAEATVNIGNPAQGVAQTARSNSEGVFVFPQLPPGTYTLSVEMTGFKKAEKSDVVLPVASRINTGDIVLEVGSLAETVT